MMTVLIVATAGALGAITKDIVVDNALQLPFKQDGKLFLGFLGGALVGAFVGLVIDGGFLTAAMAGYTGSSVLGRLLTKDQEKKP